MVGRDGTTRMVTVSDWIRYCSVSVSLKLAYLLTKGVDLNHWVFACKDWAHRFLPYGTVLLSLTISRVERRVE